MYSSMELFAASYFDTLRQHQYVPSDDNEARALLKIGEELLFGEPTISKAASLYDDDVSYGDGPFANALRTIRKLASSEPNFAGWLKSAGMVDTNQLPHAELQRAYNVALQLAQNPQVYGELVQEAYQEALQSIGGQ